MRDKLTELISQVQYMGGRETKLADYLLANGVIVPTVTLKQNLFALEDIGIQTLPEITRLEVFRIHFAVTEDGLDYYIVCITEGRSVWHIEYKDIGKTVFLTRKEAEEAIKNLRTKGR